MGIVVVCVAPALVNLESEVLSGFLLLGGRVVFPLPLLASLRVVGISGDIGYYYSLVKGKRGRDMMIQPNSFHPYDCLIREANTIRLAAHQPTRATIIAVS